MDVKIKSALDFEQFYQNEYINTISYYYEKFFKNKIAIIISRIIIGIFMYVLILALINVTGLKEVIIDFLLALELFLFFFIAGVIFLSIKTALKSQMVIMNEEIIKDITAFISDRSFDTVTFEPKLQVSQESLEKLELFNLNKVKYTGKNYTKVAYNSNMLVFSDIKTYVVDIIETKKEIYKDGKKYLRTTRSKKKRTIFEGLYFGATLNKRNKTHIYLIPNNFKDVFMKKNIMNYIKYHGDTVNLENLEFSKKYKVFSDDETQARYILSLGLMEKINQIDNLFKGKKYIVFKEGRRFSICIEGVSIEKIKNITLPIFRNKSKELKKLEEIFEEINKIFKIYHILDLGNELYVKN